MLPAQEARITGGALVITAQGDEFAKLPEADQRSRTIAAMTAVGAKLPAVHVKAGTSVYVLEVLVSGDGNFAVFTQEQYARAFAQQ